MEKTNQWMLTFGRAATRLLVLIFVFCGCEQEAPLTFQAGTYEVTTEGHNGDIRLSVTFSDSCITDIQVLEQHETPHIGDIVFDKLIPQIIKANGTGVDAMTGATVSCRALMKGVAEAANMAKVSDGERFKAAGLPKEEKKPVEGTWDVVIVGAGGAGMAAAAEAAQQGNTVLLIEKNAEIGGNTLVSGGIFQSVMPYLVWDPAHPDAKTGVGYDGKTYEKAKSGPGCVKDLETILGWDEKAFDAAYYKTHAFEPGNIEQLAPHGVHSEYLPVLQTLKQEISAYLAWAQPKLARGVPETDLTLFSTKNLHIFQTYYGGLRQSADKQEWVYSDVRMVSQMVEQGQELKPWLANMGVTFLERQIIIVGALWFRGNKMLGADIDTDGDGTPEHYDGNWGAYIMAPYTTFAKANKENRILKSTTARELIEEGGCVKGVKAVMDDGTPVTAHARKGVIVATGGYAANIRKVIDSNRYWNQQYLTSRMASTNRSSLQGDGLDMAEKVGAALTGMGWTQLMPLSYIDYGNLAFGSVSDAVFISAKTGNRFVDESLERDVLSAKAFENGITLYGKQGAYLYIGGEETTEPNEKRGVDVPGKQYARTPAQLPELLKTLKIRVSADAILKAIRDYDMAVMDGRQPADVSKRYATNTIGKVKRLKDGTYDKSTYSLDSALLTIRPLAPATHHTMGGLVVDEQRHVLDASGKPISGLYAAGEVTGGIHGGNRLGGNALTEILVSGRIAANSVTEDAKK
jgi:fumarate reductase flavoprotein subunit